MTPGQARLGAIAAAVLGILGVYISKRPTTDIAAGVIAGLAFLYYAAVSFTGDREGRRAHRNAEKARRQDAAAQWERYSHPSGKDFHDYEVGCEIELSSGVKRYVVNRWQGVHPDLPQRYEAELEADAKVLDFNAMNWRP